MLVIRNTRPGLSRPGFVRIDAGHALVEVTPASWPVAVDCQASLSFLVVAVQGHGHISDLRAAQLEVVVLPAGSIARDGLVDGGTARDLGAELDGWCGVLRRPDNANSELTACGGRAALRDRLRRVVVVRCGKRRDGGRDDRRRWWRKGGRSRLSRGGRRGGRRCGRSRRSRSGYRLLVIRGQLGSGCVTRLRAG